MAGHLVEIHVVGAAEALQRARQVQAQVDPFGLDAHGIKKHVQAAQAPPSTPTEGAPIPTPPLTTPQKKETTMPPGTYDRAAAVCGSCGGKGHRANHCQKKKPAASSTGVPGKRCAYCHRMAGSHTKRCRRKGTGGGSASPPRAAAVRKDGAPAVASTNGARALLVDHLEEELVQKRAEVRVLETMLAKAKA